MTCFTAKLVLGFLGEWSQLHRVSDADRRSRRRLYLETDVPNFLTLYRDCRSFDCKAEVRSSVL